MMPYATWGQPFFAPRSTLPSSPVAWADLSHADPWGLGEHRRRQVAPVPRAPTNASRTPRGRRIRFLQQVIQPTWRVRDLRSAACRRAIGFATRKDAFRHRQLRRGLAPSNNPLITRWAGRDDRYGGLSACVAWNAFASNTFEAPRAALIRVPAAYSWVRKPFPHQEGQVILQTCVRN